MKPNCDEFELQIGMRHHGALDPGETTVLDAHLAGCPSCRAFAAASGAIDTSLRRTVDDDAAQVDWRRLQGGVRGLQQGYRRKLWLAPLILMSFPLALLLSGVRMHDPRVYTLIPVGNLAIYLAYVWLIGRPFREVMAVANSGEALLAGYLRELRRQRLRTWLFVLWNGSAGLFMVAAALFEPSKRLFAGVFALGFCAWTAYDLFARLPRLRRAMAEVVK